MDADGLAILCIVFIASFCTFGVGGCLERSRLEQEAIERGHAEFVITDSYGTSKFQWKTDPIDLEKDSEEK